MKRYIIIILLLIHCSLSAQDDSTQITYSTDTCFQSNTGEYDRILKHIIPTKEEVKTLYKVDVFQLALYHLNFGIEKKFKANSSWEYYLNANYQTPSIYTDNNNYYTSSNIYTLHFRADYKYYHNYNRRLRKGKNTNGFSGNYFMTGLTIKPVIYNTDDYKIGEDGMLIIDYNSPHPNNYTLFISRLNNTYSTTPSLIYLSAGYGIQRRIGNVAYVAIESRIGIGTSINFNHVYIPWELNLRAGFALSSLRFRK